MYVRPVARVLLAALGSAAGLAAAAPVLAAGVPLWLVAALTRRFVPLCQPPIVRWQALFEFDSRVGWKPKPNLMAYCLEDLHDVFHVRTGSDGWPGRRTFDESEMVIFGDSHAFGYGVDAKKAFFELMPDVAVKVVAAPGYNMVQELLLMKQLSASLQGKLVVWFVYFGNDLYDNLCPEMSGYRTPFVARHSDSDWRIVTRHVSPMKWSCSVGTARARYIETFFAPTDLAERAFSACDFLIKEGRDVCVASGADLTVMTIPHSALLIPKPDNPWKIDPEYPDRMIRASCEKWGVSSLSLREVLTRSDYHQSDDHWNERGHRKVAQTLVRVHANRRDGMDRQFNDQLAALSRVAR